METQTKPRHRLDDPSAIGDGAVLERLMRMRTACQALAAELADSRRKLRAVEAELARVKRRPGGS